MRYLSVCAGIEAATMAWHPLGWEAAAFSEIEAFPRAVLAHRYPETPLHGDFTTIEADQYGPIDLLVGGTPCQSFSVAGLRGGLDDDRGNLALEFLRLAQRTRPKWLVWENVPGVLSSNGGRDFGAILGGMVECGYGFAYRVLDAQFFGVPQRRRRVFVVGYLGDWRPAAAVLFERHSLSGHSAPRREKGQSAPTIPSRSSAGGGLGTDFDCDGGLIPSVAGCLQERDSKGADSDTKPGHLIPVVFNLRGREHGAQPEADPDNLAAMRAASGGSSRSYVAFSFKDSGNDATEGLSPTLRSLGAYDSNGGSQMAVAFQSSQSGVRIGSTHATLDANNGSRRHNGVVQASAVRRLTPVECERLQGFPDNFTQIPWRGKPASECPDGPRYKALGNSMAVPVMRWIGERIDQAETTLASERKAA